MYTSLYTLMLDVRSGVVTLNDEIKLKSVASYSKYANNKGTAGHFFYSTANEKTLIGKRTEDNSDVYLETSALTEDQCHQKVIAKDNDGFLMERHIGNGVMLTIRAEYITDFDELKAELENYKKDNNIGVQLISLLPADAYALENTEIKATVADQKSGFLYSDNLEMVLSFRHLASDAVFESPVSLQLTYGHNGRVAAMAATLIANAQPLTFGLKSYDSVNAFIGNDDAPHPDGDRLVFTGKNMQDELVTVTVSIEK